jgi:hypothetical protein
VLLKKLRIGINPCSIRRAVCARTPVPTFGLRFWAANGLVMKIHFHNHRKFVGFPKVCCGKVIYEMLGVARMDTKCGVGRVEHIR